MRATPSADQTAPDGLVGSPKTRPVHPNQYSSLMMGTGDTLCPSYVELPPVGWAKQSVPITRRPCTMGTGAALCPSYGVILTTHQNSPIAILAIPLGIPKSMDYRRYYQPGGTYFFTVVTEHRQPLLIDHIDRLRTAFRHCLERHPFIIQGIVILPDHLHALWQLPEGDDDFSTRWMVIKRKFSAGLPPQIVNQSKQKKREKGIWQRRFWEHRIRDADDWQRHLDYIHYNPVKHGYCLTPAEWPHSSFKRSVKEGLYPADWGADPPSDADLDRE